MSMKDTIASIRKEAGLTQEEMARSSCAMRSTRARNAVPARHRMLALRETRDAMTARLTSIAEHRTV